MALTTRISEGPGSRLVGVAGITGTSIGLVALALFLFYVLIKIWPHPTPSLLPRGAAGGTKDTVSRTVAQPLTRVDSAGAVVPIPSTSTTRGVQAGSSVNALPGHLWCDSTASARWNPADSSKDPSCVSVLRQTFPLWAEQRLILIVLISGALGSLLHALRSIGWYVGNRELVQSWLLSYLILPITGATIALLFYVVIRGGFFSPTSSFEQTSPFGFAALAALVGMFTPQAVLKLKEVAETILSKPESGKDARPQEVQGESTAGGKASTAASGTKTTPNIPTPPAMPGGSVKLPAPPPTPPT